MSDDYERGLSKPLSNGERRALEELHKIDRDAGKPYENRDQRLAEPARWRLGTASTALGNPIISAAIPTQILERSPIDIVGAIASHTTCPTKVKSATNV
jgi:hypothetical protein